MKLLTDNKSKNIRKIAKKFIKDLDNFVNNKNNTLELTRTKFTNLYNAYKKTLSPLDLGNYAIIKGFSNKLIKTKNNNLELKEWKELNDVKDYIIRINTSSKELNLKCIIT